MNLKDNYGKSRETFIRFIALKGILKEGTKSGDFKELDLTTVMVLLPHTVELKKQQILKKTDVRNYRVKDKNVNHGNIDEKTEDLVNALINSIMRN